jgi:hypothetical protein
LDFTYLLGMRSVTETAVLGYVRAASEPHSESRATLLEACFAAEGRMVTGGREIKGRAALAEMLARAHADPDFAGIRMLSAIDTQGTLFRFRAAVARRDGSLVESFDAGEVDASGKISLILTFAGPLAER